MFFEHRINIIRTFADDNLKTIILKRYENKTFVFHADGTVTYGKGTKIGSIDSRTGEVRKNGSIIGRVEPLTDMKKAAVFYFFGFY